MASKYCSDWDELVREANKKTAKILKEDVAPVAEDIMRRHIKSDIYDAYTPIPGGWVNGSTYSRRFLLQSSVFSKMEDSSTLFISSDAKASKSVVKGYSFRHRFVGAFLKLLEVGNMGIWAHGFPRPAVSNAQDDINNSPTIERAIERGLKREF